MGLIPHRLPLRKAFYLLHYLSSRRRFNLHHHECFSGHQENHRLDTDRSRSKANVATGGIGGQGSSAPFL